MNDLFQREKQVWLLKARATARQLLTRQYSVTIEDILEICPRPKYLHRNITGGVFSDDDFLAINWRQSRKASSHGRAVRVWTLNHAELPHVTKQIDRVYTRAD